jgi:hypothetical protein
MMRVKPIPAMITATTIRITGYAGIRGRLGGASARFHTSDMRLAGFRLDTRSSKGINGISSVDDTIKEWYFFAACESRRIIDEGWSHE